MKRHTTLNANNTHAQMAENMSDTPPSKRPRRISQAIVRNNVDNISTFLKQNTLSDLEPECNSEARTV
eukprot:Em0008g429a